MQGPQVPAVLERLTRPLSLPMMGCAGMDLGLTRAQVGRLSLSGKLAHEINLRAAFHGTLRRRLLAAGVDLGLREVGFAAMLSLRLRNPSAFGTRTMPKVIPPR